MALALRLLSLALCESTRRVVGCDALIASRRRLVGFAQTFSVQPKTACAQRRRNAKCPRQTNAPRLSTTARRRVAVTRRGFVTVDRLAASYRAPRQTVLRRFPSTLAARSVHLAFKSATASRTRFAVNPKTRLQPQHQRPSSLHHLRRRTSESGTMSALAWVR